jgi:uncharacterized cupin superfamily protein
VDQALTFTSGQGKATINGKDQDVKAGDLMVVPAGTQHQFVNTGPTPLVSMTATSHHTRTDAVAPDPLHHLLTRRTRPSNGTQDEGRRRRRGREWKG